MSRTVDVPAVLPGIGKQHLIMTLDPSTPQHHTVTAPTVPPGFRMRTFRAEVRLQDARQSLDTCLPLYCLELVARWQNEIATSPGWLCSVAVYALLLCPTRV